MLRTTVRLFENTASELEIRCLKSRKNNYMEKEFRYSQKVLLREGDKIRISEGPYYPTKDGRKIKMGLSGLHYFSHLDDQGNVWVRNSQGTLAMVYMGKEHLSEMTGTYMRPHKIKKIRKKQ